MITCFGCDPLFSLESFKDMHRSYGSQLRRTGFSTAACCREVSPGRVTPGALLQRPHANEMKASHKDVTNTLSNLQSQLLLEELGGST